MNAQMIFIILSIIILLVIISLLIVFLVIARKKKRQPITLLTYLAFGFILVGIIFGDGDLFGYGMMGIGVAIAIGDMIIKLRKRNQLGNV